MNERIQELADKASQWVIDNSNGVHAPYERWNEKFAELIVQECADYISETATIETLLGERLKEHFGVEE